MQLKAHWDNIFQPCKIAETKEKTFKEETSKAPWEKNS